MPTKAVARESGPLQMHSPRFATRAARRIGEGTKNVIARLAEPRDLARDEHAFVDLKKVLTGIGAVVLVIAAVPAILGVLAAGMPNIVNSSRLIVTAFADADWGDDTANSLSPTMGMVFALTALFAVAALAVGAFIYAKRNKSG